ncbi:hypothetical protein QJS10_CPA02g01596 [Acorus calamus]|uniref:Uncharacterized protein n=1 Tax=Acorus calamus TaxID=4465 RepID=A0AAV9FCP4_ACOCL|nr:hypothetical protein QJS10_CPA02g01596 [Acorus calamus]
MAPSEDLKGLLEDLDLSETYLVCAMFEETASLASSIVSRLRGSTAPVDGVEAEDIIECAGVVFVQALKGLGRTSKYLKELELLFGSVAAIPVQTFHTGVRFQLQEGHISGLREVMEEFIGKWKLIDGKYYVLADSKLPSSLPEEFMTHYLDLVEVYAVMLRGKLLGDADLAISWVENAELPEEKRQVRIVAEQSSSLKKALSDALQLAFSVQVNPLAAVQPPTSAARLHM